MVEIPSRVHTHPKEDPQKREKSGEGPVTDVSSLFYFEYVTPFVCRSNLRISFSTVLFEQFTTIVLVL